MIANWQLKPLLDPAVLMTMFLGVSIAAFLAVAF